MTKEEVEIVVNELLEDCKNIRNSKGVSYSGKEDKLGNFKRIAATLNIPIEQVWFVYYQKHADALASFLRGEYNDSESIKGRVEDLINYLFLLGAILREQKKL